MISHGKWCASGSQNRTDRQTDVHSSTSISTILMGRRLLLLQTGTVAVLAALATGAAAALAAESGDPTVPIQQFSATLVTVMKAGRTTTFTQRFAMLKPAVNEAFDLNALIRGAVGLDWINLPPDQQSALFSAFQRYTVSNYTANFNSCDGQSLNVLPETRALPNGEVVVRTQIIRPGQSRVELDYIMRQTTAGWKAVDVLSDGAISQVAVQRSDFRRLLLNGGVAALRAGLERKITDLSGGTLA